MQTILCFPDPGCPVDVSTHTGLTAALEYITANGWNCRVATDLLTATEHILAPVALSLGCEPADAARIAWELWRDGDASRAVNLWAYTTHVVKRELSREAEAQRKLTSLPGLRRIGAAGVRVDRDLIAPPAALHDGRGPKEFANPILTTVRATLTTSGLSTAQAEEMLELVADQAGTSVSLSAASDRLVRNRDAGAQLGITGKRWRALVTLLLGTPRGAPGLLDLTAHGHPNPLAVPNIASARKRLLAAA